jgi:PadR family transcriptional regulator, regulatory protein AphA
MAIQNKTQFAILGILSIAPGTGYDIKRYCDTVISNIWHENFGHIYPVLSTLFQEGLVELSEDAGINRKKIYSITTKGKEKFMDWLVMPAEYQPIRSEFMLKFLFSSNLPDENIIKMVEYYRKRHSDKLIELMEVSESLKNEIAEISKERVLFLKASVRFGILSAEAAIMWCDEVFAIFRDKMYEKKNV